VCDEADIGRIDISGSPKRDGEARITLREQVFGCRIHITGNAGWRHVPSRWVMYSGEIAVHAATWESGKAFLIEREADQEAVWLRREKYGGSFAVERASDQQRIGEIKWVKPRLLPKPTPRRIVSDIRVDVRETFEVMLLWILVQDDYRSSD
jgi:hypothetical protein